MRAVEKNNIIWQTGSWQRSHAAVSQGRGNRAQRPDRRRDPRGSRPAGAAISILPATAELLAKLAALPDKSPISRQVVPGTQAWNLAVTDPPPELDYETWIGPSQMEPYIKQRVHMNWRWNYNTGGGQLLDWIGHHCDIAHWGLGFDNSGPSEIEGHGEFPAGRRRLEHLHQIPDSNSSTRERHHHDHCRRHADIRSGHQMDRHRRLGLGGSRRLRRLQSGMEEGQDHFPEDCARSSSTMSPGHQRNFLDCVKSRQPTITPVQAAHHSAIPGHLGPDLDADRPEDSLGRETRENSWTTPRRANCCRAPIGRPGIWREGRGENSPNKFAH